jgi:hypothetical protein
MVERSEIFPFAVFLIVIDWALSCWVHGPHDRLFRWQSSCSCYILST